MNRTRLALQILLPVAILGAGALAMETLAGLREEPAVRAPEALRPIVETIGAERRATPIRVRARGEVAPRAETRLLAEVTGRVTAIAPELVDGGFFHAGDALLWIDDTDYRLALREAELAVAQAELRVEQAEADAGLARREWERLGRAGEPSPLTLKQPQLAEATAALVAARARVERARRDVERCVVTAPYDGRVRDEHVDVGQVLLVGAEIASVYAVDAAEVRLLLPDDVLAFLDLPLGAPAAGSNGGGYGGPTAVLTTRFAGAEHAWEAEIVRTEGQLDPATRMVAAVARVEDPFGRGPNARTGRPPLAPGLFVDASIEGRPVDGVPIPRSALREDDTVFVVEDGALAARAVDVLHSERERVVVGAGLEDGDRVVVSPLAAAFDGMLVEERPAAAGEEG